ncbi:MAG: DUF1499 domain-containing protein [Elusimicrobia bacterium]|nr:DUF1499 domain-containing protein [Elusimicrobiota bacterium]
MSPGEAGACGQKPNCVSTFDSRAGRHVEPWRYDGSRAEAMDRLGTLLRALPRVAVYHGGVDYLHAEFRSPLWRFVDDVEFHLPMHEPVVHFRSASRSGFWDFGVNRRRMRRLGRLFQDAQPRR